MLHITKENNFSDSTYVVKTGDKYHLLWFTPIGEIDQCLDSSLQDGFKLVRHVTPDSFRHIHITYLQSEDMLVKINDIIFRVVHDNYEITMVYTHKLKNTENETVRDLD